MLTYADVCGRYNAVVFLVFVQLEDRHGLSHRVRAYWVYVYVC